MQKFILILGVIIFMTSCSESRIIEVIEASNNKPVAGATVSILNGHGKVTKASTNKNGQATFGTGTWIDWHSFISIKITKNDDFCMNFSQLKIITPHPNISLCGALAPHQ